MGRPFAPQGLLSFYADESDDKSVFVMSCIAVPTIERTQSGYQIAWDDHYERARDWHLGLCRRFDLRPDKELKGSRIACGRNQYLNDGGRLHGSAALELYQAALAGLDFLPPSSIFSVASTRDYSLGGARKLSAALAALFSWLQDHCGDQTDALMFCDEGHDEYRRLFRRARQAADSGFSAAIKDLNFKDSRESLFIQIADLVSYACLAKLRDQSASPAGLQSLHDHIPRAQLNRDRAGFDGIWRLGFEKQNGSTEGAIS